ncbi:hypothetical protein HPP92_028184 [Vanilla planifolia]|uniref:RRM domain-containing protein n=1 Tax=Vanilla planifolia TaxID=51239 RepID=A0A835P6B0_VANPL|nr:hypothetical protein HPP92_028184 [Vanilla planifolia]
MAKKRKMEVTAETVTSFEPVPFESDIVELETCGATLASEASGDMLSAQENGQSLQEELLAEEGPVSQGKETVNNVSDPPVSSEILPEDGVEREDDDGKEDNEPVTLQKLLEPFTKEQLIDILCNAAVKYPDLRSAIRQTADFDPVHRKIFVHGLSWDTTAESLRNYFSQYGEIEDCKAVIDRITGKSKGYGFIIYKDRSSACRALEEPQKKIGNRMAACQLASVGPVPATPPSVPVSEYTQRKIYVSNLGAELDPQKVLQFFSNFGEIEEGPLGLDKVTGKFKGFCLFVYKSFESAKKALDEPHKNFEGHILHCQKAFDGYKPTKPVINLVQGVGPYVGLQQGASIFGARGTQLGRSNDAVLMGGMTSSFAGAGHLIAPPAASMAGHLNTAVAALVNPALGAGVNNGALVMKAAFGNQVAGAGGYVKPGLMSGYGASSLMASSHGGATIGQANSRTQTRHGHVGGIGPYAGH